MNEREFLSLHILTKTGTLSFFFFPFFLNLANVIGI